MTFELIYLASYSLKTFQKLNIRSEKLKFVSTKIIEKVSHCLEFLLT